jgi:hypothetical protein
MYVHPMIPSNSVAKPNVSSQDFGTLRLPKSHVPGPCHLASLEDVVSSQSDLATERHANHPSPPSCLIKANNSQLRKPSMERTEQWGGGGWVGYVGRYVPTCSHVVGSFGTKITNYVTYQDSEGSAKSLNLGVNYVPTTKTTNYVTISRLRGVSRASN